MKNIREATTGPIGRNTPLIQCFSFQGFLNEQKVIKIIIRIISSFTADTTYISPPLINKNDFGKFIE